MIAPDPEYSRAGYRRVLFYSRPEGAFAQFRKTEYLVPEDRYGTLVWALYEAREELPRFARYRETVHDATRDLLVCAHGTVDPACARFGYPLYRYLRNHHANDYLRVWRVSHFGGHVFAPTMMDMPTGHYWAYVEEAQARQIVQQDGDARDLYKHYRGWAGLNSSFIQAAERELWMRHGWNWFGFRKTGRVVAQDADEDEPKWADVQLDYAARDDSVSGSCAAHVEVHGYVQTAHSTNHEEDYSYPQYTVTALETTPAPVERSEA
jgi:hypothetical protein